MRKRLLQVLSLGVIAGLLLLLVPWAALANPPMPQSNDQSCKNCDRVTPQSTKITPQAGNFCFGCDLNEEIRDRAIRTPVAKACAFCEKETETKTVTKTVTSAKTSTTAPTTAPTMATSAATAVSPAAHTPTTAVTTTKTAVSPAAKTPTTAVTVQATKSATAAATETATAAVTKTATAAVTMTATAMPTVTQTAVSPATSVPVTATPQVTATPEVTPAALPVTGSASALNVAGLAPLISLLLLAVPAITGFRSRHK